MNDFPIRYNQLELKNMILSKDYNSVPKFLSRFKNPEELFSLEVIKVLVTSGSINLATQIMEYVPRNQNTLIMCLTHGPVNMFDLYLKKGIVIEDYKKILDIIFSTKKDIQLAKIESLLENGLASYAKDFDRYIIPLDTGKNDRCLVAKLILLKNRNFNINTRMWFFFRSLVGAKNWNQLYNLIKHFNLKLNSKDESDPFYIGQSVIKKIFDSILSDMRINSILIDLAVHLLNNLDFEQKILDEITAVLFRRLNAVDRNWIKNYSNKMYEKFMNIWYFIRKSSNCYFLTSTTKQPIESLSFFIDFSESSNEEYKLRESSTEKNDFTYIDTYEQVKLYKEYYLEISKLILCAHYKETNSYLYKDNFATDLFKIVYRYSCPAIDYHGYKKNLFFPERNQRPIKKPIKKLKFEK